MGNYCCTDDVNKGVQFEEFYSEAGLRESCTEKSPCYVQVRLETVKEEACENSEFSDNRSISRTSKCNPATLE